MSNYRINSKHRNIYVVILCLQLHFLLTGCGSPPKLPPSPLPVELQHLPRQAWSKTPFSTLVMELPPQYQLDDEDRYYQGKKIGYIASGEEVTLTRYIWSDVNSRIYGGYWVYIQAENLEGWHRYDKGFSFEGTVEPEIYFDTILKHIPVFADTVKLNEARIDISRNRKMSDTCAVETFFQSKKLMKDVLTEYYDDLASKGWYFADDLQVETLTTYLRMRESAIADVAVFSPFDPKNQEWVDLLSSVPTTKQQQSTVFVVRASYEGPIKGCEPQTRE